MPDRTITSGVYQFDLNSIETRKYSEKLEIRKIFTWGDNVVIKDNEKDVNIEFNDKKYPVKVTINREVIGTFTYK